MLSSLMAAHNFGLHHGQLTSLLRTWEMLFGDEHHLVLSYLTANTDVYLVFDRYYKNSIKGLTRAQRTGSIASNHVLSLSTPIPSKEDTMLSTVNKVQIYHLYHLYHFKVLNTIVGKHKL